MSDPNGGGFGPPGGAPPPGGGFGPPPGGPPPQGGGFGTPPPGGGGFGTPPQGGGFAPGGAAPQMQATPGSDLNIMPAFIMGIFTTTMCGCMPLGLGALYMADQAKKAAFRGDDAGAKSKLMISYGLSAVSFVCAFVLISLYLLLVIASEM